MSRWTWLLAIYLLGLTAVAFYSVYLADQSKGLFDKDLMFVGRSAEGASGAQQEGLMNATRAAVTFYKGMSYAVIIGNALVIISLFLLDFKISWRSDPPALFAGLPAIGGRRR